MSIRLAALDIESTLTATEGLDWLAQNSGSLDKVREITEKAMAGMLDFEQSLRQRLAMLSPTKQEIEELQQVYIDTLFPNVLGVISELRDRYDRVVLISGGLRPLLLPLAKHLGFADDELIAVNAKIISGRIILPDNSLLFNPSGKFDVFNSLSPASGPKVNLMVGDGMTDACVLSQSTRFVAVGSRQNVIEKADDSVATISDLMGKLNSYDVAV